MHRPKDSHQSDDAAAARARHQADDGHQLTAAGPHQLAEDGQAACPLPHR
ncbi:MAG: hypothetical protein ABSF03_20345 [Streptosporangiaceae bacterium]